MLGRRLIEVIGDGNIDGSSLTTSLGESDGNILGSSVSIRLGNYDGIDDDLIDVSGIGKAEWYAVGTLDGMEHVYSMYWFMVFLLVHYLEDHSKL